MTLLTPNATATLVVALVATGVHVATAIVLLALDARSTTVRRYVLFLGVMVAWLVLVAVGAAGVGGRAMHVATGVVTHLLPLAFVAFVLALRGDASRRPIAVVTVGALALFPVVLRALPWYLWVVDVVYQVGMWTAAAVLLWRAAGAGADGRPAPPRRLVGALAVLLLVIAAVVAISAPASAPFDAALAAPALSTIGQFLALVGAVRFQLYGIARRAERTGAARTGALARDAAELERLALLGELGATVAHEVRNPLTGIRSLAQRLGGDEPLEPARRARFSALIVSEVDRLDRFVGSMLALARRDGAPGARPGAPPADAREAVALARLAEDRDALVHARASRRGVRVVARVGAATVDAPRGPLAQVLLNLLLNAVEHSPDGAEVTLESRRAEGSPGGVALAVRDRGPGVPADVRERIFEPFAAGERGTTRGTGLGLAVVRRVAESNGWRVAVTDAPGGGAEFSVEIPNR